MTGQPSRVSVSILYLYVLCISLNKNILNLNLNLKVLNSSYYLDTTAPIIDRLGELQCPGLNLCIVCKSGRWIYKWHDDVIKWKYFPRYWPFVWGIHRSPVNSPHKGQWRGALMLSLISALINAWVNNRETRDLRCHRTHYDVIVMSYYYPHVFCHIHISRQSGDFICSGL